MNTREQVRQFYDRIGWSQIGEGLYQNARYEDLRPVSQEYIHKCHLRVKRYLPPQGRFFLDAGSGPVQWPEYLSYSEGYRYRVCVDISITALREARRRLGDHGLYVVADITHLPFAEDTFEGLVSLHAIHHLPLQEHRYAYLELQRVLQRGGRGAIVNGWHHPLLTRLALPIISLMRRLRGLPPKKDRKAEEEQQGTFVAKMTPTWLKKELHTCGIPFAIYPWRSFGPLLLRWFIRPEWGGKFWLRVLYWLEERFPRFFGEHGQYPIIVIWKE
jgi:ubiquinone/menaquinone biosynthesis C-methylase UbiE